MAQWLKGQLIHIIQTFSMKIDTLDFGYKDQYLRGVLTKFSEIKSKYV